MTRVSGIIVRVHSHRGLVVASPGIKDIDACKSARIEFHAQCRRVRRRKAALWEHGMFLHFPICFPESVLFFLDRKGADNLSADMGTGDANYKTLKGTSVSHWL